MTRPRCWPASSATEKLSALADCDLVIESVVEDLDVKTVAVQGARRDRQGKSAILATNTSTLPVVDMAVVTDRPRARSVGVHFFNPAPMMSLVEIVRPLTASDETVAAVTEFAEHLRQGPG
jgi:3-hydroxybutyryl-CoA dehydrogenase